MDSLTPTATLSTERRLAICEEALTSVGIKLDELYDSNVDRPEVVLKTQLNLANDGFLAGQFSVMRVVANHFRGRV